MVGVGGAIFHPFEEKYYPLAPHTPTVSIGDNTFNEQLESCILDSRLELLIKCFVSPFELFEIRGGRGKLFLRRQTGSPAKIPGHLYWQIAQNREDDLLELSPYLATTNIIQITNKMGGGGVGVEYFPPTTQLSSFLGSSSPCEASAKQNCAFVGSEDP